MQPSERHNQLNPIHNIRTGEEMKMLEFNQFKIMKFWNAMANNSSAISPIQAMIVIDQYL